MKESILVCHKLIINAQEYGTNDEYMVSVVEFSYEINGKRHDELKCTLKQTVGSDIEKDPIEVSPPIGYDGPINYANSEQRLSTTIDS
jgi:hypothetical protein